MPRHARLMILAAVCLALAALAAPARAGLSHFSGDIPARADDSRLRAAAEGGSAEAQYLMGSMLMVRAEERDLAGWHSQAVMLYKKAAGWFHQAAGEGHAKARFSLGLMHLRGLGVERNTAKALRWLEAAAKEGDPDAHYVLGTMLAKGEGVRRDLRLALLRLRDAGQGFLEQGRADWLAETARTVRALSPGNELADAMEQAARDLASAPHAQASGLSMGTAWIAAPGFAVTNNHVVAGRTDISLVHPDGSYAPATVAAVDEDNDLALLAVEDRCTLPPALPLAASAPGLGAPVFTVGFPEPALMGASAKLSTGRVTGGSGAGGDGRTLQISVPVTHGNSGGPLVDLHGRVVGVVSAMIDQAGVFRQTGEIHSNINFAIRPEPLNALLASAPTQNGGVMGRIKSFFTTQCPELVEPKDGEVEDIAPVVQRSVLMVVAK